MVPSCSMEPKVYGTETRIHTGAAMGRLQTCHKQKKTTTSYDVQTNDVQRAVAAIQHFPSPVPPDSPFISTLGTPAALKAPPQTDTLAQRALEEWERTLCENKAVAILAEIQAGRPTIIPKMGVKCSLPLSLIGHWRKRMH